MASPLSSDRRASASGGTGYANVSARAPRVSPAIPPNSVLPPNSGTSGAAQPPVLLAFPAAIGKAEMPRRPAVAAGAWRLDRWLAARVLQAVDDPGVALVLWNGAEVGGGAAAIKVIIHDRATLWKLALNSDLEFGEAYAAGRVEVEGDLQKLLELVFRRELRLQPGRFHRAIDRWRRRARSNTLDGSRANIHQHYDLGDDFYRLWLDDEMVYTCGYFPSPGVSLEQAQRAKMRHICRKVWLRPGETVAEAGCGWGALALYMARHYGVTVKAYNVSHEQIKRARRRARAEGLSDRVEFIEDDYRNIQGRFDVFVSVGMLEHVGPDHHAELGAAIDRCLSPVGRGLIHSIGRDQPCEVNAWIERRIFPGSYPPSLHEIMHFLEPRGFSLLDLENLRLHYAETLRHWLLRFDAAADMVANASTRRLSALAALLDRLDGELCLRQPATVPACVFAAGDERHPLDPRATLQRDPLTRKRRLTTETRRTRSKN